MNTDDTFVIQKELVKKLRELADQVEADAKGVNISLHIDASNQCSQRLDASFSSPTLLNVHFSWHRPTPDEWPARPANFQSIVK